MPASASDQLAPPSIEYWYFVIAAPPSAPAVKSIVTEPSPASALNEVGADGVVAGVNEADADDAAPEPAAFTARSFTV